MYSRRELGEIALRRINAGDIKSENKVDIRDVMFAIDQERDRAVGAYYRSRILAGERQIPGDLLETFVVGTSSRRLYYPAGQSLVQHYVELPCKIISLPYDMGVYQISQQDNPFFSFMRRPSSFSDLYVMGGPADTTATAMDSLNADSNVQITWWIEGTRIFFSSDPTIAAKITNQVTLNLLAGAEGFLSTDGLVAGKHPGEGGLDGVNTNFSQDERSYKIPADLVGPVVDAVVQKLSIMKDRPEDLIIDNQDKA